MRSAFMYSLRHNDWFLAMERYAGRAIIQSVQCNFALILKNSTKCVLRSYMCVFFHPYSKAHFESNKVHFTKKKVRLD